MYSTFEKLSEDKKQKIIKVCIDEFSANGYESTSTDVIAEKAEISKGSLFYYFKNKKGLYLYIIKYVYSLIFERFMKAFDEVQEQDFFERIKALVLTKQRVTIQYYNETRLIMNALSNPPVSLKKECEDIYKDNWKTYERLKDYVYKKELIHSEYLRDNISAEISANFTAAILERLSEKFFIMYSAGKIDLNNYCEAVMKELDEYIDIIKYGIFKRKDDKESFK